MKTQKEKIDIAMKNLANTIKYNSKRWHQMGVNAKVAAETEHRLVQKCSSHEVSEAGVQVHKATIVRSTKHHLTEG